MSSKARRLVQPKTVTAFDLSNAAGVTAPVIVREEIQPPAPPAPQVQMTAEAAAAEGFAKGFAQGERAGAAAAAEKGEALLSRLLQTLDELSTLRTAMIRQTERQMVELALVIARRVVQREVSMDADLLMAMARVALDRLADSTRITVRLHPQEFDATAAARAEAWARTHVQVVSDSTVPRGGCRVESECGVIDAGPDAQIHEIARALLGDDFVSVKRNGQAA